MIAALKGVGIDVYADVVLNHMANDSWKRSDLDYPGTEVLNDYASQELRDLSSRMNKMVHLIFNL